MNKPEILSPCGGPESLQAAINAGADAVYLGTKYFSARHNAVNFSDAELESAVRECHRNGVLVYLAINTVILKDELKKAAETIELACRARVDGLIIQDMAVYEIAKTACPDMPLHASTQMSIHTKSGAEAAKCLGFKRVVAARELPLFVLREMVNTGVEIEAFAHGALCMCVSGQCYLSAAMGGRSANRGMCAGACRLPFSAKKLPGEEDCALSLKDLSYCSQAKELANAGIASLKIEGRMKRPEYVAAATDALKKAVDGKEYNQDVLRAVFSRSGFTDGYLDGHLGRDMFGARLKEDVLAAKDALPQIRKIYEKPRKRFKVSFEFSARKGEKISLKAVCDGIDIIVFGDEPENALNRETSSEDIYLQLEKLGGTIYECESISVSAEPGLMIPKSAINSLRRQALDELDAVRIDSFKEIPFDGSRLFFDFPMPLILKHPKLRARVESITQLKLLPRSAETAIPLCEAENYIHEGYDPALATILPPRFDICENKTVKALKSAKKLGFDKVECGNIGQIKLAHDLGLSASGGFGLNITNSLAARHYYFKEGLNQLLLSPELKPVQQSCIAVSAQTGAVIYGRLPLMITRNCPIAAEVGCENCKKRLIDRTGEQFPVICRKSEGYYEILNTRPIWLADKLSTLNLDFGDLWFTVETPEQCLNIWQNYLNGLAPKGKFSRGFKIN